MNVRTAARIRPKSPAEVAKMREAGRIVGEILAAMAERIKAGTAPVELDEYAEAHIRKRGATPSFKGYHGFPKSLCISVNEEVVHGIPGKRALRDGDVVTVDCGAILDGWHGDAARTYCVGEVDAESRELLRVCEGALMAGAAEMRPRKRLADVSKAVEGYVKRESTFSVVRQYVGHGIGRALHEEPQVPNYYEPNFPHGELVLEPGHVFAIEPMVNAGTHDVRVLDDLWTVVTADGRRSAHFEHTVAVTEDGPQVLTLP
jgi:methionyl aminopeptidase